MEEPISCPVCGRTFLKKRSWQTFCSDRCRRKWPGVRRMKEKSEIMAKVDEVIEMIKQIMGK